MCKCDFFYLCDLNDFHSRIVVPKFAIKIIDSNTYVSCYHYCEGIRI